MIVHAPANSVDSPLAKRYDPNGTVWIYGKYVVAGVIKTGILFTKGATGWESKALFDVIASQTAGQTYIGFPEVTQAVGSFGWAQVGGRISAGEITSCTSTAGHAIMWYAASLKTTGDAQEGASRFGAFITTAAASTTHDMMLFDVPVAGIS